MSGGLIGNGSDHPHTKDWRARLHLERRTVDRLHEAMRSVAEALGHALNDDELFGALDSRDDGTRRQAIGMLMVLVSDAATGRNEFTSRTDRMEGREELLRRARSVLQLVEVNPQARAASFARYLRIDQSLPLRTQGLMNTPLGEIFAKTRHWFVVQQEEYASKADGLERILRDLTVPEDFRRVMTAGLAHKQWFVPSSIYDSEGSGYIPLGYLP